MISHEHKAVFVHIPRCGGQSIESVFLADLGLDWSQRAPLLLREQVEGELGPLRLAHLTAHQYVSLHYLSRELFNAYRTFSVVRDPYVRAGSMFRHLGLDLLMSFDRYATEYLPKASSDPSHPMHWFVQPQSNFIFDGDTLLVDRYIRLESLAESARDLFEPFEIVISTLPHVNGAESHTLGRDLRSAALTIRRGRLAPRVVRRQPLQWTPDSKKSVAAAFEEDFVRLGYEMWPR